MKPKYFLYSLFAIVIMYFLVMDLIDYYSIKNNKKIATCYIEKAQSGGKGGVLLDYSYFYKSNKFNSQYLFLFVSSKYSSLFLKKNFPIAFDSLNPSNSKILLTKDEFERYDINFPDSLNWIEVLKKESL